MTSIRKQRGVNLEPVSIRGIASFINTVIPVIKGQYETIRTSDELVQKIINITDHARLQFINLTVNFEISRPEIKVP